jgi:hypothetical protein
MTITLAMLQARAIEQVQSDDLAEQVLESAEQTIESGAAGTASMLAEYLTGQGISIDTAPKGNKVFDDACEALRVGFRSQYCNRVRKIGGVVVNTELARMVLDATETVREGWAKDSTEKKLWTAVLGFGRTKLQRVALVLWPKKKTTDTANGADKAGETETKKAPTADAILANLDAFIAEHGKDSVLTKNLRDQLNARFK